MNAPWRAHHGVVSQGSGTGARNGRADTPEAKTMAHAAQEATGLAERLTNGPEAL
jgi:hypothetical protein